MKTIVLIIAAGLTYSVAEAQSLTPQVFNNTGGTYKKGYYALDWSIGEVPLVEQYKPSGETYIITNGYLQSFTDSQKPSYVPGVFGRDEIIILPNPTSGRLEVNFLIQEKGEAQLTLYDGIGRRILTRHVTLLGYGRFERFDLTPFAGSAYFLAIEFTSQNGQLNKKSSYKITKIK